MVRVWEMCQQDFHSACEGAEHHLPFYTVLPGSRRRRCSLREEDEDEGEEEEEMLPLLLC